MIKEIYSEKKKITSLSIVNNKINAVLKSNITQTGLRLYDQGCIGISGAIGSYDENDLISGAKHMLGFKIPYDCKPAENSIRTVDLSKTLKLNEEGFIETSKHLLETLTQRFPQFAFSHKIILTETEVSLNNDLGTDLLNRDQHVSVELLVKYKHSKNIMDGFGLNLSRLYDYEDALKTVSLLLPFYEEKVEIPDGKMPVVFLSDRSALLNKFYSDLNGKSMGTKASIFAGKIGQKLFSEDFSLLVDRDVPSTYGCFFDNEGTILVDDRFMLIENGVLKSPFTSKRIAKQFQFAESGSAGGEYDSVPDVSARGIDFKTSGKTIRQLLGGRKAILVEFASGGDFTSQGEFASPVQSAYLFDGDQLYGRLPQLSISSNMYDMFGKDYIGVSTDGISVHNPFTFLALELDVKRIGDWV